MHIHYSAGITKMMTLQHVQKATTGIASQSLADHKDDLQAHYLICEFPQKKGNKVKCWLGEGGRNDHH
eukprot:c44595_g1_i1 orf=343-546(+)